MSINMKGLEYSILKVLAYFDVFNYPLLAREVNFYLDLETAPEDLSPALEQLTGAGIIFNFGDYYTLQNDEKLIQKRIKANNKAAVLLPKAKFISDLLYIIPFVRAIGISGSLSKHVAHKDCDFDFFIITKANRLWTTRAFLMLMRRCSALVGKRHWFCLNYYIDEDSLQIPEQNIFTATELFTLILPQTNQTGRLFLEANHWVDRFYPHYHGKMAAFPQPAATHPIKKAMESILNIPLFNHLDDWIMYWSTTRLIKKKRAGTLLDLKGRECQLPLVGKHYCKPNPVYFQAKVMGRYTEKLNTTLQKFQYVQG
jgi:hypothetical protein